MAERTGTAERYVREWLENPASSGLIEVDDAAADPLVLGLGGTERHERASVSERHGTGHEPTPDGTTGTRLNGSAPHGRVDMLDVWVAFHVVEDAGHVPRIERPEGFQRALGAALVEP